nr:DNA-processing protein DprA [uncultured Faecalimonas sp.]
MEKKKDNIIEQEEKYRFWFAGLKGIRAAEKIKIAEEFPQKNTLYYIEETALKRRLKERMTDAEAEKIAEKIREGKALWDEKKAEKWRTAGVRLLTYEQEDYPERLRQIALPPYAVYVMGKLPQQGKKTAAVVGARNCSYYGETYAARIGSILSEAGISVISGMARGVDAAAQRGALHGRGGTFGVLGSGVDVCYPRENKGLYEDLKKYGGILSEQLPGSPPLAQYFPARNRLISGLADVVIVIEARERSGSLITADMALEQGKDVYALPGSVDSQLSRGCNRLIRQGAGIILSPEELLEDLNICGNFVKNMTENKITLETEQNIVYSCLDLNPKSIGQILAETKLPIPELMRQLVSLEMSGTIMQISKGYYVRGKR